MSPNLAQFKLDAPRKPIAVYATTESDPVYRPALQLMHADYAVFNELHFEKRLPETGLIQLAQTGPRALGDFSPTSDYGGGPQIRIHRKVAFGGIDGIKTGAEWHDGRMRICSDILLHELVHLHLYLHMAGLGNNHGPQFADECNRIGEKIGVCRVRPHRPRKGEEGLPSCAHWPHRDAQYYLGALETDDSEDELDDDTGPDDSTLTQIIAIAQRYVLKDIDAVAFADRAASILKDVLVQPSNKHVKSH